MNRKLVKKELGKGVINLLGVTFKPQRKVWLGLKSIYGIGKNHSEKLMKILGIKKSISFEELEKKSLREIPLILDFLGIKVRGELKKVLEERLVELETMKLQRGIRRRKGYPVRGQRRRTNAKTARKKRK